MHRLLIAIIVISFGSTIAFAQAPAKVSLKDFKTVFGKWEGSLTYLDYGTGKPFSMPANIAISGNGKQLFYENSYPEEAEANECDTALIAAKGTMVDDEKVVSKRKLENGNLEIITEITGVDGNDNKSARMRHTYTLGRDVYVVRKDVLFEGEKDWVMRHEYRYHKSAQ
jgi:hypothetical protein